MSDTKKDIVEREYIINLRRDILKAPKYKRTPKAVKAIKKFVVRHMKVEDRDESKVRIDKWLNNELWFRGIQNPPTKIKIKVKKEGGVCFVSLAEIPEALKYKIERVNRQKELADKLKKKKEEEKKISEDNNLSSSKNQPSKPGNIEEKEKELAAEQLSAEISKENAKAVKHVEKIKPMKSKRGLTKELPKKVVS
ncbi:MAG: 50S ribosomal protein L31e [Candidatus Pacearchaeota archaeon]